MINIGVNKVGDWAGVPKDLIRIKNEGPIRFRRQADAFAKRIRDKVRDAIRTGGKAIGKAYVRNAKRTINRKGADFPLIDVTLQYYSAINVSVDKVRRRGVYGPGTRGGVFEWDIKPDNTMHIGATRVGKRGRVYKQADIRMMSLAVILERGANVGRGHKTKIPARPHWRPVAEWARMWAGRSIASEYTRGLFRGLRVFA